MWGNARLGRFGKLSMVGLFMVMFGWGVIVFVWNGSVIGCDFYDWFQGVVICFLSFLVHRLKSGMVAVFITCQVPNWLVR